MEQNEFMHIRSTAELKETLEKYAISKRWKPSNAARYILEQFLYKQKKKRG